MTGLADARSKLPDLAHLDDGQFVDAVQKLYYPQLDKATLASKLGYTPPAPPVQQAGVLRTAGDVGIKLAQGVVDLGSSVVGLGSLATGGAIGKGMRAIGYDPKATNDTLGEYLSDSQKRSDAEVSNADGFVDSIAASVKNPRSILGSIAESAPGMVGGMGVTNALAGRIAAKAALATAEGAAASAAELAAGKTATEAAKAAISTEAGKKAADAAIEAAGTRLIATGAATEGAQSSGQIADQAQGAGRNYSDYALPALAAGAGTAAIGLGAGKLMGDSATELATGARSAGVHGNLATRAGKEFLSEGVLEEMPQSAQEQVFTNMAMGDDLGKGVANAAGTGLIVGGAMGAGMGALQKHHGPADAPEAAPTDVAPAGAPPAPATLPNTGPLSQAANAGQAAAATIAGAAAPGGPAAPSAAPGTAGAPTGVDAMPLADIEARLKQLDTIGRGTPAARVVDDLGITKTVPSVKGRQYTPEEQAEFTALMTAQAKRTAIPADQMDEYRQLEAEEAAQKTERLKAAQQPFIEAAAREKQAKADAETARKKAEDDAMDAQWAAEIEAQAREEKKRTEQEHAQRIAQEEAVTNAIVENGRIERAAAARKALRDDVLNDPKIPAAGKKVAFAGVLKREGYTNPVLNDEDHEAIDNVITPSRTAPNELVDAVPERIEPPAAPAGTANTAAVDAAIASGMRLKTANGSVLHKPGSTKVFKLSAAQKDHYLKRMKQTAGVTENAPNAPVFGENARVSGPNETESGNIAPDAARVDVATVGAAAPQTEFDAAAHEAATSPHNDRPEPTEAQKEAGNYKVGRVSLHGLDISIENPAGSVRKGIDKSGTPWETTMQQHYGYIRGTVGADKDHIDTFIGKNHDSNKVFVVDQVHPETGKFDEHKVMLGFDTAEEARAAYQSNYDPSWTGGRNVTETTVDGFKAWLAGGKTKKPFSPIKRAATPAQVEAAPAPATTPVAPRLTKQDLNKMTVKDMSDDHLLQAKEVFAGQARAPKIQKEIDKRGLATQAPAPIEKTPAAAPAADVAAQVKDAQRQRAIEQDTPTIDGAQRANTAPEHANVAPDGPQSKQFTSQEFRDAVRKVDAVNDWWDDIVREHGQWFTGDGKKRKLRLDAPAEVQTIYRDYLKSKKAAADAYNGALTAEKMGTATGEPVQQQAPINEGIVQMTMDKDSFKTITNEWADLFADPAPNERVRMENKVGAEVLTPEEARARIAQWKEHAQRQGDEHAQENSQRTVLSLFDLTGEWSKPWEEAGYNVQRFDIQSGQDVFDFSVEYFTENYDLSDVYAILAATPCTDFASSGAKHFLGKDQLGQTEQSVKLVNQTAATIEYFRPAVWALENPVGRIQNLTGLPDPRLSFDPNHFGDPYTKKTMIWGRFNADLPSANVEASEGSKMHSQYGGKSIATKNARSETPEGFAYAFFMANNYIDMPVERRLTNEYPEASGAVKEALKAGISADEIHELMHDTYGNYEYEEARDALAKAVADRHAEQAPQGGKQEAAQDPDHDDGADIPAAFFKKVTVPHEVYIRAENRYETVQLPADKALASVREDIDNLRALLKCMGA